MKAFISILIISIFFSVTAIAQNAAERSTIIENYRGESYYMHFVKPGETVQSLAKLYNVLNVEILKANPEISSGLQPNKVIRIPVKSSAAPQQVTLQDTSHKVTGATTHIVQPKETWYGIARYHKIPVTNLIGANPSVDTLKAGMEIVIPAIAEDFKVITEGYAEHTVQEKETLYSLARRYHTTTAELTRLNPSVADGLKIGQVLMVPASSDDETNGLKIQVTDTVFIRHEVKRKETLYGISKLYSVDQIEILKANPSARDGIKKGDQLRIPTIVREVKPFAKPDTIIMGRAIDQQATGALEKVPCSISPDKRREYNIALLVPLRLEMVDSIRVSDPAGLKAAHEYMSFDFIQFYEGVVIAADSMAAAGMKVKLHVYDADYGDEVNKTRRILNKPEMAKMDLIIGPFFAESFNLAASFAKDHEIPVINPLSKRSEFTAGNEFVIKLQPSGWAQYNTLAHYLRKTHSRDNIILVRRNSEENAGLANVIKSSLTDSTVNIRFHEVMYSSGGWSGINKNLSASGKNIVIIATSDKAVLPALLRDLNAKSESQDITVVGLPEWEELELDYNHLIKLNTHFFKPWMVNYNDPNVKHFLRVFRSRYIAEPEVEKYAYLGYDASMFFLSALYNYGNGFLNCIEKYNYSALSTKWKFIKANGGGYENFGTTVYKYTDFTREILN